MAKNGLFEYYSQLPAWAKGVIAVAVIGGVGIIGYKVYKKVQQDQSLKDSDKTAKDAKKEYQKLLDKGQTLTHPKMVYQTASNSIVNSLDGCETPMSEGDVVKTVMATVRKPIDWYYLVMVFDSKLIDNCLWGSGDTAYALPELLKDQIGEPSSSILQTHLKSGGITL